jgi:hypothetical protein
LGIRSVSAASATAAKKAAYQQRWLSGKPSKVCFFLGGSENMLILSRMNRTKTSRRNWGEKNYIFSRFFWHLRAGFWGHKDADPRCYTCRIQNAVCFRDFSDKKTQFNIFLENACWRSWDWWHWGRWQTSLWLQLRSILSKIPILVI